MSALPDFADCVIPGVTWNPDSTDSDIAILRSLHENGGVSHIEALAEDTGYSERTIYRRLRFLSGKNIVWRQEQNTTVTFYSTKAARAVARHVDLLDQIEERKSDE